MDATDFLHVPPVEATRKVRRRYLDNPIWMEILCRLPSTKSVFQCRCVSKQWNSLISNKYFISQFIDHHRENYGTNFDSDQLLLFFGYMSIEGPQCGTGFLASFRDQWDGGCMFPRTVHLVESSFNDLLVCSDYKTNTQYYYYIFNPFTKEHVELPVYPSSRLTSHVGFVCEPFYTQGESQFGLKPDYRYRVVRVVDSGICQPCTIETYCSETREWSARTCLERDDYGGNSNLVAHNGKLYWYNFRDKVVVYDPFATTGEPCFHFHGLSPTQLTGRSFQMAESQGSLLLMQFATNGVSIWKLKENGHDDHDVWCFERRVIVNHVDKTTPSFIRQIVANGDYPMVLGVHPSNEDVIFMGHSKSPHVASYNSTTEEWLVVGEIQQIIFDHCALFREFGVRATLPWWPTPVY